MALKTEQLKSDLLDEVIAKIRNRLSAERVNLAVDFVSRFYANVPLDDIVKESPDNLYGAALSLLGFAEKRKAGAAGVRVYNPRLEEQGWRSSHTIVEIVNDDMPFLVDSVTAELSNQGVEVHLVIHPVLDVERDAKGKLKTIFARGDGAASCQAESYMQAQISEQPVERHEALRLGLESILRDVRAAVEDWPAMRERLRAVIEAFESNPPPVPSDELDTGRAFLNWMADDHFTYLGYREYTFEGSGSDAVARVPDEGGLGVLRDPDVALFEGLRKLGKLPADVSAFLKTPNLLRISKANRRSTVHRSVHLDTVAVKTFDKKGRVLGEQLFAGLFTSVAYSRSPREIPMLREKIERVILRSGFDARSHDGKALLHILDTFPRDELIQTSDDALFETAMGILHLQERQRVALFLRKDSFERFVSALIYVPRDRFDTSLRIKLQDILAEAYEGKVEAYYTHLTDETLARLHVIVKTKQGAVPEVDLTVLEEKLTEAARSWADRLEEALVEARGEEQGLSTLRRFARAFPVNYQDHFNAHTAVLDIARIEEALASRRMAMNLYRPIESAQDVLRFKLYVCGDPVPLSDVLPMLENMGLRVVGETPFNIRLPDVDDPVSIHDFYTKTEDGSPVDLQSIKDAFHDTFAKVWHGEMDNDGFNKLVVAAGLTASEVKILRAYCKYLRQAGIPFSQAYMEETLKGNPKITKRLVDLFVTRFDPGHKPDPKKCRAIVDEIRGLLDEVVNLDEDRILRRFLNIIESTLRTNFFQQAAGGGEKNYVSFKFDSANVEDLPLPRPFREIFVYSPRIEGVHLRFGKVARGGLRWSDRREDFRTEILGLVKAQQVKNAVIVPVGSKGGFVVKKPPPAEAGRDAFLEEGIACYRTFISGLLDITDNLSGNEVIPPDRVVRYDKDDPYLVVAADKGTATFSDIANGVSADYGFWLDDAFASGGSAGYDHKKMGITARGAWESVKRHFREIGKDTQNDDFTCLGVGDMSGDVFGNGMLLSKHIKLVGAFNHLHIFVDPDPDPAKTWVERQRMFELPRSTWADYNEKLISKGGGIFDRKAKSLKISAEMKKLFNIKADQMTPNELITAMLLSKVELLWFGGIGTYIKASQETHHDAGDRANDAIRIDAKDLKAKVVGEGANLGMTQRARIEYSFHGGRCNTDSIDNSAGVDCSDHEVNIKILLGGVETAGDMTRKQRDKLLEEMTDEVSDLVLRDNYLQTQSITVTHQLGHHLSDRTARFMRALERAGQLNRAVENLPDDETIGERQKKHQGFTRPELAVLLSYAKIVLYDELLATDLPDDPYVGEDLITYFPTPLRKTYRETILGHRLRREIVATVATNELVNRVGITFVHEVREKTGMAANEIARAYIVSRDILELHDLWSQIEALDNKVPAEIQSNMLIECGRIAERLAVWVLREAPQPIDAKGEIDTYAASVKTIAENLAKLLSRDDKTVLNQRTTVLVNQKVPKALAQRIAALNFLSPACDIVRIAQAVEMKVEAVAETYFRIGERFGFNWLRRAAGQLSTDTAWDKLAVTAVIDDLYGHQAALASRVLESAGDGLAAEAVIDSWADARRPMVVRSEQLLSELKATGSPDFAMLAVANRQLKTMVGG